MTNEENEKWRSCTACGRTIGAYQDKLESSIQDLVEPISNPFDLGKSIVSLENKLPKHIRTRERKRFLDKINKEPEEDIKAALKTGCQVEIQ